MCPRTDLLSSLASDLRPTDRFITSDQTVEEARITSLRSSLFKKWLPSGTNAASDALALAKFIACNDACAKFELVPTRLYDDEVIGEVKAFLDNCFFSGPELTLGLREISREFGVGPGASVGAVDSNFYTKLFASGLSTTDVDLYRLYRLAISPYSSWVESDDFRQTHYGLEVVQGSSLSFVPKTSEISRTICTEPILNMLFQKGIGRTLERILKRRLGIDLASQPDVNRIMARIGSTDGSFGTIDLQSASDSISLTLVRAIFPPYVVRWLESTSCRKTRLPSGDWVELNMISSMGNAFTFPLQTLIFSAIVTAVYRVMGIKPKRCSAKTPNFAVFGDDIIVCREAYDYICHCLRMFGFSVNDDKSFNSGHFRESCGHDYYRGANVRGVYLRSLDTSFDVYSAFNRLSRWSSQTGIPLTKSLRTLYDMVPCEYRLPVPYCEPDTAGFKTSVSLASGIFSRERPRVKPRGKHLARFWKQEVLRSYALFLPDPLVRKIPTASTTAYVNPVGVIISSAEGQVRGAAYTLRSNGVRYKVALRSAKTWHDRPGTAWDPYDKKQRVRKLALVGTMQEDFWEEDFALHLTMVEL